MPESLRSVERACLRSAPYVTRFSLSAAFLSAVADRLGLWGGAGVPGVVWGNFDAFSEATAMLNPWCPASVVPALAWFVTIAEVVLAASLMFGFQLRRSAFASAVLLGLFVIGMVIGYGVKSVFDYSVLSAMAAALLLGEVSTRDAGQSGVPAADGPRSA